MLKDEKLGSIIRELAAEYVNLESNRDSLITVTKAEISSRGKKAVVFFSVVPVSAEQKVLEFLNRHRGKLRHFLLQKKFASFVPRISFAIDLGEKNRQHIDELFQNL